MADEPPSRKLIIPKGVLESGNNVVEIPESCEDSRVLIAKLQAKFNKPPRYYPPKTNPENKFERRIGDVCVGLGMPPLSPVKEERRDYKSSFSRYGPPKPRQYESYDPSYFGTDTTHGSQTISGKFDYCPTSTPIATRQPPPEFPSPHLSPIRMGRDIFAPEPSVYRSDFTPPRMPSPPPRMPSPPPPPRPVSPSPPRARQPVAQRRPPPMRRPPSPVSDGSCSLSDISGMLDVSRGYKSSLNATPESIKGLSNVYGNYMSPKTPVPAELDHSVLNQSLIALESVEMEELACVRLKMRNFQDARRDLMLSILSLQEIDVPCPTE